MNTRSLSTGLGHVLLCAALLALVGCDKTSGPAQDNKQVTELGNKIESAKAEIAAARQSIDGLKTDLSNKLTGEIKTLQEQKQSAANFVFAAQVANNHADPKNLYVAAVQDELVTAQSFLPGPTSQAMQDANTRLKLRLDQTEQSRAELQRLYEEAKQQAKAKDEKLKTYEKQVEDLTGKIGEAQGKVSAKQEEIIKNEDLRFTAEQKALAKEQELRKKAEDDKALREMLVRYLVIAGILVGIGAALALRFYPSVVLPLAAASAGLLIGAYIITSVPWWVFFLVLAGVAVALVLAGYIKHRRVAQIADNSIGAIEQMKNAGKDGDVAAQQAAARLKKELEDWFGQKGHELDEELQNRLRKLNQIN